MKQSLLYALALSTLIALPSYGAAKPPAAPSKTEAATELPSESVLEEESETETEAEPIGVLSRFSTTDLDGDDVDQSILADYDLNMINLWATYCGPCLNEMPHLGELAEEYANKHVQIIGIVLDVINSDGSLSESQLKTAQDIVSETNAAYTHIVPSSDLFALLYQFPSVPSTFFVDHDGNLVGDIYIGAHSKEEWADILDQTLAEVSS